MTGLLSCLLQMFLDHRLPLGWAYKFHYCPCMQLLARLFGRLAYEHRVEAIYIPWYTTGKAAALPGDKTYCHQLALPHWRNVPGQPPAVSPFGAATYAAIAAGGSLLTAWTAKRMSIG